MPQKYWRIKLSIAIALMIVGFLISIAAFIELYQSYLYLPYPEIKTLTSEEGYTESYESIPEKTTIIQ